jgi:hypothetical protein
VLSEPAGGEQVKPVLLAPDGLVLMPSVFNWPDVSVSRSTSTQSTLVYPAGVFLRHCRDQTCCTVTGVVGGDAQQAEAQLVQASTAAVGRSVMRGRRSRPGRC